jgi:Flp pilus assembly protein TadD
MIGTMKRCSQLVLATVLLAGCGAEPVRKSRAPPAPPRDLVAEIRAEAARAQGVVEVNPLADPAIADLKAAATTAESEGRYDDAERVLQEALDLRPEDPALWQWMAELSLRRRAWDEAQVRANKSFDLGPRLGELCIRNWLTIRAARLEKGDAFNARSAEAQLGNCAVKPVLRM